MPPPRSVDVFAVERCRRARPVERARKAQRRLGQRFGIFENDAALVQLTMRLIELRVQALVFLDGVAQQGEQLCTTEFSQIN